MNKNLNKKGFTLTEVMIGIMILTIAIVSASNLLVSLVNTNRANVHALQAFYLAQEGIEAMRNIRDTNWLHNLSFDGEGSVIYDELKIGSKYVVYLESQGWENSNSRKISNQIEWNNLSPWHFEKVGGEESFVGDFADIYKLYKNDDGGIYSYINGNVGEDTGFYRHIEILEVCDDCEGEFLVKSVVSYMDGSKKRSMELEEIITNWKGGAL